MSGYKFGDLLVELLQAEREGTASPSQITTLRSSLNTLWDDYNLMRTWLQPGQSKILGTSINFPINLIYSTGILSVDTVSIPVQIPQAYNHLMIFCNCRKTQAVSNVTAVRATINGDTGTNYAYQYILAIGSTVSGASVSNNTYAEIGAIAGDSYPANEGASSVAMIPNYRGPFHKHILILQGRMGSTAGFEEFEAQTWLNTAAITDMTIISDFGNIKAGSAISIYGLL
jgi:hypothetical protein